MNHLLRALILRAVVIFMPLAVICAYGNQALLLTPRTVATAVTPTATIDTSNTTIGIADSSLYGLSPADIDTTLNQLQSIGVQNIRVFVPWGLIEPLAQGQYNWTMMDNVMNAAAAHNMGVLAVVSSTPLWAAPSGTLPGAGAPNPTDYVNFMKQVVTRYGSTISAYEIWNEPNSVSFYQPMDPVSYTNLLKAVYPVIKQLAPNATVIAGALAPLMDLGSITASAPTYVQAMYAAGAQGFFDALSLHPYDFSPNKDNPLSALSQVEGVRAIMVQNGDSTKLIWASEYGWQTALNANGQASQADQQSQANFISDMINAWRALTYTGPLYIYTTRDGTPGTDTGYGIYQADWTPKLAVAVIQQAIADAMQHNPVTSPIVALAQWIQSVVSQVQQALTSFTAALQTAITNAIKAVTDALTAIFNPAAASATAGAATAATATTAGAAAMLAAKTSATALQTQVAESKATAEAATTAAAAEEKSTADATKAVDTKATDAVATDSKTADPKAETAANSKVTADPKSTDTTPASAVADGTKGTTAGADAGTAAPDKTSATSTEPAADTTKTDGTKSDGGRSDTSSSAASQSDSSKADTSKADTSNADTSKADTAKSGSQSSTQPAAASSTTDTKSSGKNDTKSGNDKSDSASGQSSGVKLGHSGGQPGPSAAAATDPGKSDTAKSVDTTSGNKHTPRSVGEQSKPTGRSNSDSAGKDSAGKDSAGKDSSSSAGSQSHESSQG